MPCERLRDDVARRISSASRVPSFEHALSTVVRMAMYWNPTTVTVLVNAPQRGFAVISSDNGLNADALNGVAAGLSQLADIAHVHVTSKCGDSRRLCTLDVHSGTRSETVDRAAPTGTRVDVTNLFHNLPVRRRALDAALDNVPRAHSHTRLAVQRVALLHCHVRWIVEDRPRRQTILSTRPIQNASIAAALGNVFGFADNDAVEFHWACPTYRVRGLIGSLTNTDHRRCVHLVYVNGQLADTPHVVVSFQRVIAALQRALSIPASSSLATIIAVIEGGDDQGDVVWSERDPACRVYWDDLGRVPSDLVECLRRAVHDAIRARYGQAAVRAPAVVHALESMFRSTGRQRPPTPVSSAIAAKRTQRPDGGSVVRLWRGVQVSGSKRFCCRGSASSPPNTTPVALDRSMLVNARVLRQVDSKFIVAVVDGNAVIVIDQHAADERVRLEQLEHEMEARRQKAILTTMTVSPAVTLAWSSGDLDLLEQVKDRIEEWGFQVVGLQGRFALRRVPVIFGERLTSEDLLGYVRSLHSSGTVPPRLKSVLASKACRSAIMFGDVLSVEQCGALVGRLATCKFPFQCAHGRPSVVPLAITRAGRRPLPPRPNLARFRRQTTNC